MTQNEPNRRFLLCLNNEAYPASLEVRKVYEAIHDENAESRGFVRILDESGDDYLYPSGYLVAVELPQVATKMFAGAS